MEDFRARKRRGERITALTAYDYPTARLLDESGIDIILVGDSLGMVVLGYPDTTEVTFEEMLHHTRAAARGVKRALLVADLSIGTYDTPEMAVAHARRLVEAGAQAVKLEGGLSHVPQIEAIVGAGSPFVAHTGMAPAAAGKVYELWLQQGATMVRAGLIPARPSHTVLLQGDAATAAGAGITIEVAGGSATPTLPPVALISFA